MQQSDLAARQFGDTALNYLYSNVHAQGADLQRVESLARGIKPAQALDLGCGAGHVAFALARAGAPHVTAYDLSAQMLALVEREARARAHATIECRAGTADQLPFADGSVDLIVTRFSAHHWSSVPAALLQAARVLRSGGTLVVIDVVAPESALLDTTLQTLELLRDLSHVRNYRVSEWCSMLSEAGFALGASDGWRLRLEFDSWVRRIGTSNARIEALRAVLAELPAEARDYLALAPDLSFSIDARWFEATRG